ncbi:MAG: type II toxin-antitoxin system prevent-host-death family antitoxin [Proteobacteria bacterium]|nr:type II toxin-antitoxin system prevent-host-death family antitoxin [Pseudomonadota bacterium]
MTERISVLKVRQNLGEIINRVYLRNNQFIIERAGKPVAALIPVQKLEQIQAAARGRIKEILEKNQKANPDLPSAKASELVREAVRETRKRYRAK